MWLKRELFFSLFSPQVLVAKSWSWPFTSHSYSPNFSYRDFVILLFLSFLLVGCSPQPEWSNAHFLKVVMVLFSAAPLVRHSWWNLYCSSLAFTWLWDCIFPSCPLCSVSELLQVREPGVLSTVTFPPSHISGMTACHQRSIYSAVNCFTASGRGQENRELRINQCWVSITHCRSQFIQGNGQAMPGVQGSSVVWQPMLQL